MAKRIRGIMPDGTVPFGRCAEFEATLPHPERTAKRYSAGIGCDATYQEWPSRAAMLVTIRMQGKREVRSGDWKPVIP